MLVKYAILDLLINMYLFLDYVLLMMKLLVVLYDVIEYVMLYVD